MTLSKNQLKHLRQLAHVETMPTLLSGQHGITEAFLEEGNRMLDQHELIRIRIRSESREQRMEDIKACCEGLNAELVKSIGKVCLIYRLCIESPKIALPSK